LSVEETLAFWRSLIPNVRFLVVNGEKFAWGYSDKGLGYAIDVRNLPVFTDEKLVAAVVSGKSIAIPTGRLSDNLIDVEFDIYETLGSEVAAKAWLSDNLLKLEGLQTILIRSPQFGFHVLGFLRSDSFDLSAITDWLLILAEDSPRVDGELAIRPDIIHFNGSPRTHYVILTNYNNCREYLTSCRTILIL